MTVDDYDKFVLIEYEVGPDGELHRWIASEDITAGEILAMAEGGEILPDTLRIYRATGISTTPMPAWDEDTPREGCACLDGAAKREDGGDTPIENDPLQ